MTDFDFDFLGDLVDLLCDCLFARFPIMSIIIMLSIIGFVIYLIFR